MITDPSALYPYFYIRTSSPFVGTSVVRILTSEPRRVSIIFTNTSTQPTWISPFSNVSTYSGIFLNSNETASSQGYGSTQYEIHFAQHGGLTQTEWYAFSLGNGFRVSIIETLWQPPDTPKSQSPNVAQNPWNLTAADLLRDYEPAKDGEGLYIYPGY